MIYYFAGALNFIEIVKYMKVRNVLSSWIENKEEHFKDFDIFLDSAAFTAFTKGIDIDINEYIKYIKTHKLDIYAALDVIGDAETSKKNIAIMVEAGLKHNI